MIPPVLLPGDVFQRVRLPNAAGVEGKYVRIASVSGDLAQLEWVNNSASDITEGTLAAARLPATAVQTTGSYADPAWITALAASKITGTFMKSQQHFQTAYLDATSQVFAGAATFNGLLQINGASHGNNTYLQLLNNSGAIGILGSDASISGGNAADVGLSVYGDNEFCLWTNSTRMIRVNDSGSTFYNAATFNGNLGIGVSPTTLLDIKGDPSVLPHAYIRSTTTGRWAEAQFDNGNNQLQLGVESSTPSTRMTGTLANGGYVGTYGNYGLTFHTNNQNRLTIDANGVATFNGQVGAASGIAVSGKIQISNNGSSFGSTLSNGSSQFYNSLTAGLMIAGAGSTSDLLITNKSGGDVFSIPTGTVNADFAGSVSALSLNADVGSNKPLRSYRDVSYSGWYNGASLASNEAYYMGSSAHYFSVGGTNRLEVGSSSQFSGNLTVTGLLNGHTSKLGDFTVATLPSAAAYAGYEANVTDSSVTTFGSTVAGSGSSRVKVYSNGTNWTVQAA